MLGNANIAIRCVRACMYNDCSGNSPCSLAQRSVPLSDERSDKHLNPNVSAGPSSEDLRQLSMEHKGWKVAIVLPQWHWQTGTRPMRSIRSHHVLFLFQNVFVLVKLDLR